MVPATKLAVPDNPSLSGRYPRRGRAGRSGSQFAAFKATIPVTRRRDHTPRYCLRFFPASLDGHLSSCELLTMNREP
jgi:hypothetical protein